MYQPFCEFHLFQLLEQYDQQHLPLDIFMSNYFRLHKACGSKDRRYVAETAYSLMRWKGLLDYLGGEDCSWEERFRVFSTEVLEDYFSNDTIPLHVRCSFPENLFELLVSNYGEERAFELCLVSNHPAPTTVRVNTLKIKREELLKRWKGVYDVEPCRFSEDGIIFNKKINFFASQDFKDGFFEIQDEGSQLLAGLVQAEPGEQVLDYCAGGGGKALAIAPRMNNRGQLFLHDIRPHALLQARQRLKRAGVQNSQTVNYDSPQLKKLKKKMDWVLVDAPCSGSGTMRRNPDMKWKFDSQQIQRLVGEQRKIFEKALSFLKPGGKIVYATCSIFHEENQRQAEHFMKTYGLKQAEEPFQSLPRPGGMDGFFGAVLTA
ncbi:MAG: RsmB/NOP family class I SAM-dependent RNA methyltransferase [Chlamydiota bacterium]